MHGQQTVNELRIDPVLVDALRELERAEKRAIGPLDQVIPRFSALGAYALLLAADSQDAVFSGHFNVGRPDAGELDLEDDLLVVLSDVDGG